MRAEGQYCWAGAMCQWITRYSASRSGVEPVIRQIFIGRGADVLVTDAPSRKLYIIRKRSGHAIQS